MEQSLSAHEALLNWRKDLIDGQLCISSVLLRNDKIPLFEERYGFLDYDWFLEVTKDRKCIFTEPTVIRYVSGNNLSRDSEYRKVDFYMNLMRVDRNLEAMKRIQSTRGRYYYSMGKTKEARFWFRRGNFNYKTVLYYITSYLPIRKYICKKFRIIS